MGDRLALPPLTPHSSSSVLTGRPAPSNYRCSQLTVRQVKVIHWFLEARPASFLPPTQVQLGTRAGPGAGGSGHSCQLGSELALIAEGAAVCQHLPVSHMGLPGSLGALWRKRVLPANGPRVPVAKPQRVPGAPARAELHCGWAGSRQGGLAGQRLSLRGPLLPATSSVQWAGYRSGGPGRPSEEAQGFLWLYCCPFPLSTLPGLPHRLIAGWPGPPGSISCCRPEPDTSYPLHHGPAQPPAS